jgi:hypothetical protein
MKRTLVALLIAFVALGAAFGGTTLGSMALQGTVETNLDMTVTPLAAATFTLADTGVSGTSIATVLFKANKATTVTITSANNGVMIDGALSVAYQFAFETGGSTYVLGSASTGVTLTTTGNSFSLAKTTKTGVTYTAHLWIAASAVWDAGVFTDNVTISIAAT